MKHENHTIQRVSLLLELNDDSKRKVIEDSLVENLKNEINGFLSDYLAENIKNDEVLIIDKLEIDLGNLNFDDLENEFVARFRTQIAEKIKKSNFDSDGNLFELLNQYLTTSTLPWWGRANTDIAEIVVLLSHTEKENFEKLIALYLKNFHLGALTRLANYIEIPKLINIAIKVLPDLQQAIDELVAHQVIKLKELSGKNPITVAIWSAILESKHSSTIPTKHNYIIQVVRNVYKEGWIDFQKLKSIEASLMNETTLVNDDSLENEDSFDVLESISINSHNSKTYEKDRFLNAFAMLIQNGTIPIDFIHVEKKEFINKLNTFIAKYPKEFVSQLSKIKNIRPNQLIVFGKEFLVLFNNFLNPEFSKVLELYKIILKTEFEGVYLPNIEGLLSFLISKYAKFINEQPEEIIALFLKENLKSKDLEIIKDNQKLIHRNKKITEVFQALKIHDIKTEEENLTNKDIINPSGKVIDISSISSEFIENFIFYYLIYDKIPWWGHHVSFNESKNTLVNEGEKALSEEEMFETILNLFLSKHTQNATVFFKDQIGSNIFFDLLKVKVSRQRFLDITDLIIPRYFDIPFSKIVNEILVGLTNQKSLLSENEMQFFQFQLQSLILKNRSADLNVKSMFTLVVSSLMLKTKLSVDQFKVFFSDNYILSTEIGLSKKDFIGLIENSLITEEQLKEFQVSIEIGVSKEYIEIKNLIFNEEQLKINILQQIEANQPLKIENISKISFVQLFDNWIKDDQIFLDSLIQILNRNSTSWYRLKNLLGKDLSLINVISATSTGDKADWNQIETYEVAYGNYVKSISDLEGHKEKFIKKIVTKLKTQNINSSEQLKELIDEINIEIIKFSEKWSSDDVALTSLTAFISKLIRQSIEVNFLEKETTQKEIIFTVESLEQLLKDSEYIGQEKLYSNREKIAISDLRLSNYSLDSISIKNQLRIQSLPSKTRLHELLEDWEENELKEDSLAQMQSLLQIELDSFSEPEQKVILGDLFVSNELVELNTFEIVNEIANKLEDWHKLEKSIRVFIYQMQIQLRQKLKAKVGDLVSIRGKSKLDKLIESFVISLSDVINREVKQFFLEQNVAKIVRNINSLNRSIENADIAPIAYSKVLAEIEQFEHELANLETKLYSQIVKVADLKFVFFLDEIYKNYPQYFIKDIIFDFDLSQSAQDDLLYTIFNSNEFFIKVSNSFKDYLKLEKKSFLLAIVEKESDYKTKFLQFATSTKYIQLVKQYFKNYEEEIIEVVLKSNYLAEHIFDRIIFVAKNHLLAIEKASVQIDENKIEIIKEELELVLKSIEVESEVARKLIFHKENVDMIADTLFYFLENITLPWWAPYSSIEEFITFLNQSMRKIGKQIQKWFLNLKEDSNVLVYFKEYLKEVLLSGEDANTSKLQSDLQVIKATCETESGGLLSELFIPLVDALEVYYSDYLSEEVLVKLNAIYIILKSSEIPETSAENFEERVQELIENKELISQIKASQTEIIEWAEKHNIVLYKEETSYKSELEWDEENVMTFIPMALHNVARKGLNMLKILEVNFNDKVTLLSFLEFVSVLQSKTIPEIINPIIRLTENPAIKDSFIDLRKDLKIKNQDNSIKDETIFMVVLHQLSETYSFENTKVETLINTLVLNKILFKNDWLAASIGQTVNYVAQQLECSKIEVIDNLILIVQGEVNKKYSSSWEGYLALLINTKELIVEKQNETTIYDVKYNSIEKTKQELQEKGEREKIGDDLLSSLFSKQDFLLEYRKISMDKEIIKFKESKVVDTPKKHDWMKMSDGDRIYIMNAGLVMFWPFLTTLFKRLGYVEKGVFVTEESSFKAIHLLQYLTDKTLDAPEHLLVLNKILCGVPVETFVPIIKLSKDELTEADMFLDSVKSKWKEMKNSSIETFLKTFIQREGMLEKKDKKWNLFVENKPIDILLTKLPWGMSLIKLPWNDYIIFTEWKAKN